MIHTWNVLHNWSSKASLYFNKWWSIHNYNSKPFNPALTSLEEVAVLGYIQKPRDPAQWGHKSQGDRPNMLMESPSMPDLCLTEPDLSLTECNCQSESWSDWHLNLLTEASTKTHPDEPKTCGGEREGEIPHKGCWISTLDLIWSPPSVKDLSNPVDLVPMRLISIKSVESPLI